MIGNLNACNRNLREQENKKSCIVFFTSDSVVLNRSHIFVFKSYKQAYKTDEQPHFAIVRCIGPDGTKIVFIMIVIVRKFTNYFQ
jgi:hypothetical protein